MTKQSITIKSTRQVRIFNLPKWFFQAMETYKQRRVLERLDDAALRDIGINAAQRDRECARKFWDF